MRCSLPKASNAVTLRPVPSAIRGCYYVTENGTNGTSFQHAFAIVKVLSLKSVLDNSQRD